MTATPAPPQSTPDYRAEIDARFLSPPELWAAVEPLLPEPPGGGRPREPDRQMFAAIFYLLTTGIQWDALPRCLGASSTVHDRFQEWREAGVFEGLWATGLIEFDASVGLDSQWQALDGAMTKAPLGGGATGPNPTDRGKSGTKRHLLTEGHGLPVGGGAAEGRRRGPPVAPPGAEPRLQGARPDPRHGGLLLGRDPPRARAHPRVPEAAAGRPPHAEAGRPRVDPAVVGGRGEDRPRLVRAGGGSATEAPAAVASSVPPA